MQNRIQEALSLCEEINTDHPIYWANNECSKRDFFEFSVPKLSKSMAYNIQIITTEEAEDQSNEFIKQFDRTCRFFTNWYEGLDSWYPITGHTFDCCLIAVDKRQVGAILIIDDD